MSRTKLVYIFTIALFAITGCTTQPAVDVDQIPDFYLNPPKSKNAFYGVGSARLKSLDLSRQAAIASARADIAGQVNVTVKNALTNYAQQAGEGDNQQALSFVETISRQISQITLEGAKTEKISVTEDGTVYALVSYLASKMVDDAGKEFQRNEAAAYAEFKAAEALKLLNSEIQANQDGSKEPKK